MWPTEDSTMKSEPRIEPMVFAFAGDSTITSALPISTTSLPRPVRRSSDRPASSACPPVLAKRWPVARHGDLGPLRQRRHLIVAGACDEAMPRVPEATATWSERHHRPESLAREQPGVRRGYEPWKQALIAAAPSGWISWGWEGSSVARMGLVRKNEL